MYPCSITQVLSCDVPPPPQLLALLALVSQPLPCSLEGYRGEAAAIYLLLCLWQPSC